MCSFLLDHLLWLLGSFVSGGCPSTTWHILEVIVNAGMVLEVGTRWIGFGKVTQAGEKTI